MHLSSDLTPLKHELFFSNYFSSPEFLKCFIKERKIWAIANLNKKHSRKCAIPLEKEIKKEQGCGFSKEFLDSTNSVVVSTWFDNKQVLIVSNFAGKESTDLCERYERTEKKKIDVEWLNFVAVYNNSHF